MRNYRSIELPSVDGGIGRVTTQAAANRDPQGMLCCTAALGLYFVF